MDSTRLLIIPTQYLYKYLYVLILLHQNNCDIAEKFHLRGYYISYNYIHVNQIMHFSAIEDT